MSTEPPVEWRSYTPRIDTSSTSSVSDLILRCLASQSWTPEGIAEIKYGQWCDDETDDDGWHVETDECFGFDGWQYRAKLILCETCYAKRGLYVSAQACNCGVARYEETRSDTWLRF